MHSWYVPVAVTPVGTVTATRLSASLRTLVEVVGSTGTVMLALGVVVKLAGQLPVEVNRTPSVSRPANRLLVVLTVTPLPPPVGPLGLLSVAKPALYCA